MSTAICDVCKGERKHDPCWPATPRWVIANHGHKFHKMCLIDAFVTQVIEGKNSPFRCPVEECQDRMGFTSTNVIALPTHVFAISGIAFATLTFASSAYGYQTSEILWASVPAMCVVTAVWYQGITQLATAFDKETPRSMEPWSVKTKLKIGLSAVAPVTLAGSTALLGGMLGEACNELLPLGNWRHVASVVILTFSVKNSLSEPRRIYHKKNIVVLSIAIAFVAISTFGKTKFSTKDELGIIYPRRI